MIGEEAYFLSHGGELSDDEMQSWADAQMLKSRLSKIRGRVTIEGFGPVEPGQMVELENVGERFEGKVFVSGIVHEIKVEGWQTHLELGLKEEWFSQTYDNILERPANGLLPAVSGPDPF